MQDDELSIGAVVRYPRTGTTGKIVEISNSEGYTFAKLDSTELFYRADMLIPARSLKEKKERTEISDIERLNRAEDLSSEDLEDAFDDVTGVGAG